MQYPLLRLNSQVVKKNIQTMALKARSLDVDFRPHFKTHQSHEIGKWFKEFGVSGITVSSLAMAEFFAEDGWNDISVAFPINILDIDRINMLANNIKLKILVCDTAVINYLENKLISPLSVYIEMDPNYGRSGVRISDSKTIDELIDLINKSENLGFEGFYAHAGHSYKCNGKDDISALAEPILSELSALKLKYGGKLCWGDTPSCSILTDFQAADQISPGNFVFYDWMQAQIGSCNADQIGVYMECPIVAKFDDRKELLIHGGAVHLSKEFILNESGNQNFGQVINPNDKNDSKNYLRSISQEHGIIACSKSFFNSVNIGDVIQIYPIHSCLTADLMQAYITESDEVINHFASGAPFKG